MQGPTELGHLPFGPGQRPLKYGVCAAFSFEHVRHFVWLLFVFGVQVRLSLGSDSALLFRLVWCLGNIHMLMLNVDVHFQC